MAILLESDVRENIKNRMKLVIMSRGTEHALDMAINTYESASAKAQNTVLPADKIDAGLIRDRAEYRIQLLMEHREKLQMDEKGSRTPLEMEPREWVEWMLSRDKDFDYIIQEAQWWEKATRVKAEDEFIHERWKKRVRVAKAMQTVMR